MALKGLIEIKLLVKDEQALYTPFNPEAEFSPGIKSYIKSKIAVNGYKNNVRLTVLYSESIDEDKFRTAAANMAQEEGKSLRQDDKRSKLTLAGLLIIASLFIVLSLFLKQQLDVFSYTIIPVLGSVALGSAARICILELPVNRVKLKMLKEIKTSNTIVFERIESEPSAHST